MFTGSLTGVVPRSTETFSFSFITEVKASIVADDKRTSMATFGLTGSFAPGEMRGPRERVASGRGMAERWELLMLTPCCVDKSMHYLRLLCIDLEMDCLSLPLHWARFSANSVFVVI